MLKILHSVQQIVYDVKVIGMNSQVLVKPNEFFQARELLGLNINSLFNRYGFNEALLRQKLDKCDFDMIVHAEFTDGNKVIGLHRKGDFLHTG